MTVALVAVALFLAFKQIKSPAAIAIDPVAVKTPATELGAIVKTSAVSAPFRRKVKTSDPLAGCVVLVVLTLISVMVIANSADMLAEASAPRLAADCNGTNRSPLDPTNDNAAPVTRKACVAPTATLPAPSSDCPLTVLSGRLDWMLAVVSSPVLVPEVLPITTSCASLTNRLFALSVMFAVLVASTFGTLPKPTCALVVLCGLEVLPVCAVSALLVFEMSVALVASPAIRAMVSVTRSAATW